MVSKTHTFSIETTINPNTGEPFGTPYAGVFSLRKPTMQDKLNIETAKARILSQRGTVDQNSVERGMVMLAYAFAFVATVGEDPPKWWNLATMEDDSDEDAVFAVLAEVSRWMSSFRPGKTAPDGGATSA